MGSEEKKVIRHLSIIIEQGVLDNFSQNHVRYFSDEILYIFDKIFRDEDFLKMYLDKNNFINHENVKDMMIWSLKILEYFAFSHINEFVNQDKIKNLIKIIFDNEELKMPQQKIEAMLTQHGKE